MDCEITGVTEKQSQVSVSHELACYTTAQSELSSEILENSEILILSTADDLAVFHCL